MTKYYDITFSWLNGATIVLLGSTTGGPGFVSISPDKENSQSFYPTVTISENIWSVVEDAVQTCKRTSTLRLVSAAFRLYLKDSRIGGFLDLFLPLQDFLLLWYLYARVRSRNVLTS